MTDGHTGTALGADLHDLWKAGRDNLPTVARVYSLASSDLGATHGALGAAFTGAAPFGGDVVLTSWRTLADQVQKIMADTADNLEDTGVALCLAVEEFAAGDAQAAEELNRLKTVSGDPAPVSVPDPTYP